MVIRYLGYSQVFITANPSAVMKVVSLSYQSFIKLARYKEAADVLRFGAELLEQQGRNEEAPGQGEYCGPFWASDTENLSHLCGSREPVC